MYKCEDCGHIFDEGEDKRCYSEEFGYYQGCPICEGFYEETYQCENCRGEFTLDELKDGFCEDCINEFANNPQRCYENGEDFPEEVMINGFLSWMFTKDEINEILYRELQESIKNGIPGRSIAAECRDYVEEHGRQFAVAILNQQFKKKEVEI